MGLGDPHLAEVVQPLPGQSTVPRGDGLDLEKARTVGRLAGSVRDHLKEKFGYLLCQNIFISMLEIKVD